MNDPTYNDTEYTPGVVDVSLSLKLNIEGYNMVELNIGINEPYSGMPGNTRQDKLEEIYSYIQDEVNNKIITTSERAHQTIKHLKNHKEAQKTP